MPIWLRKFTFNEIKKYYEKQAEDSKRSQSDPNKTNIIGEDGKINRPAFAELSKQYQPQNKNKAPKYS